MIYSNFKFNHDIDFRVTVMKFLGTLTSLCNICSFLNCSQYIHISTFFIVYEKKCYLKDKDIDSGKEITHIKKVESDTHCQQHCQKNIHCESFVYIINTKACVLKSRKVNEAILSHIDGLISGPKYCEKGNVKKSILLQKGN